MREEFLYSFLFFIVGLIGGIVFFTGLSVTLLFFVCGYFADGICYFFFDNNNINTNSFLIISSLIGGIVGAILGYKFGKKKE